MQHLSNFGNYYFKYYQDYEFDAKTDFWQNIFVSAKTFNITFLDRCQTVGLFYSVSISHSMFSLRRAIHQANFAQNLQTLALIKLRARRSHLNIEKY